jgi:succinoglycan biosynthesis transport protein ExoP
MNVHWDETIEEAEPLAPVEQDASAAPRTSYEAPARALHFRELINLLRRRSRLILNMAVGGAMLAFAAGLLIPPKYTAKAQIAIEPPSSGAQTAAPSKDDGIVETYMTMLISHDHLQHVVDNLLDDPEFQTPAAAVHRPETERIADRTPRHATPAGWLPGPRELARRLGLWVGRFSSGGEPTLNVEELERHLRINQEGRSRIIAVSYTSTDPDTAATIANRIAELYVDGQSDQKRAYTSGELARLDSRIAELKIEVERSGAAVQAFMRQRIDAAKQAGTARDADQNLQLLERQAVVKGQLYHTLLRRQQEIRDQQETITPGAYILSLATTPERPSSSNPFLFIFPALILFSICGSLLAVILERLDRGLRSERDINEALGIPCIGLVPQVPAMNRPRRLHQYLVTDPFAAYAEAVRSVVATRQLVSPFHPPKVILFTSSLPGEGKTTLAVSLSVCMALLGQRVLLIDLDFKHPSILRELNGKAEQHGILDLLLKNRLLEEVIQSMPELGLDYLPMNRCSFDPLILFGGEEMPRLLRQLRKKYDCVIIDSPPVLLSTETRLLAAMADETLFVVKWGSTPRELAQNALNLLRRSGDSPAQQLRHVSALISQVDLKKQAHYGYGDAGEYYLNYEKYSPVPSEARPAITFSGSQAGLLKSSLASASNQYREAVSTLFGLKPLGTALNLMLLRRYRLAIFRIRLLQLRISTSFSDAWNHLGRWHSKPAAQRITPDNQA